MLGKILGGRYELIEKVGVGGMAIVYKAKCRLLDRYVAVKILRPDLVEDEEFVKRFKRESQAAASLSHQNIVNVYDVGQEDGIYYIVMEYICGRTLKDVIREEGPLSSDKAIGIAMQIGDALEHAHKNGIVHRDIKPQNILIDKSYNAKVADFGIARAVTSATITLAGSNVMGSVHYFSPEQARGGYIDAKSDLYSLGIVLYEMVTGTLPFEGDTAVSIAIKHIQDKVKPPGEINPNIYKSLQAIIGKATEKVPERRYLTAGAMVRDLERSLREPNGDFVVANFDSDAPTQILSPLNLEEAKVVDKDGHEDGEEENPKQGKKRKPWVKVTLLVIPFLIIMGLAFFIGSRIWRNNFIVDDIEVPRIINMTMEDAERLLKEKKLFIELDGESHDDEVGEGLILSQDPEEGTIVKPDDTVKIILSLGPESIVTPNVLKSSKREAEITLENEGFVLGDHEYVNSEYPADTVIGQSIPADSKVEKGSEIWLTISLGPEEKMVPVGNYVGQKLDVATQMIKNDSLKPGKVREEHSDKAGAGIVISQSLKLGEVVPEFRSIDLVVSLGPLPTYPKDITIDLTNITDKETVNIVVKKIQDGHTTEVYNRFHAISDEILTIPLEGKGVAEYAVFIDGELSYETTIDFTKKGGD